MADVRTFYACQKVSFGNLGSDVTQPTYRTLNGIQSVGITTNFNLDPVYQLGRLHPVTFSKTSQMKLVSQNS